jgi:hypothetical protein
LERKEESDRNNKLEASRNGEKIPSLTHALLHHPDIIK